MKGGPPKHVGVSFPMCKERDAIKKLNPIESNRSERLEEARLDESRRGGEARSLGVMTEICEVGGKRSASVPKTESTGSLFGKHATAKLERTEALGVNFYDL